MTKYRILIVCSLGIFAFTAPIYAQNAQIEDHKQRDEQGIWLKDSNSGCNLWRPNSGFGAKVEWSGACNEGYATGSGIEKWYNSNGILGNIYEGKITGKFFTSSVKITYSDGSTIWGYIDQDGLVTGEVTAVYANKSYYVGGYIRGVRDGSGKFAFSNGDTYVGEFKSGRFEGKGTLILVGGRKYSGYFKDGTLAGQPEIVNLNLMAKMDVGPSYAAPAPRSERPKMEAGSSYTAPAQRSERPKPIEFSSSNNLNQVDELSALKESTTKCGTDLYRKAEYSSITRHFPFLTSDVNIKQLSDNTSPNKLQRSLIAEFEDQMKYCRSPLLKYFERQSPPTYEILQDMQSKSEYITLDLVRGRIDWGKFNESRKRLYDEVAARLRAEIERSQKQAESDKQRRERDAQESAERALREEAARRETALQQEAMNRMAAAQEKAAKVAACEAARRRAKEVEDEVPQAQTVGGVLLRGLLVGATGVHSDESKACD